MAIYRINGMGHLHRSKDPQDRAVFEFALKNNRSLSYRDYKYLYCLLSVERISLEIGGQPMHSKWNAMQTWLDIASAEKKVELTGKALCPQGVPEDIFRELQPMLEAEVHSPDLSYLVRIREKIGGAVSKLLACSVNGETHAAFWRKITVSMFLLDTLSDAFKDRRDGIVGKLNFSGFLLLAGKLVKNSLFVMRKIGFLKSIKLLFSPSVMTITGGFENEEKKEKQWFIAVADKTGPKSNPQTSERRGFYLRISQPIS